MIGERLRQANDQKNQLAILMDTIRDINEQRGFDNLLRTVVRRARLMARSDLSVLVLHDDEGRPLVRATDGTITPTVREMPDPLGAGLGAEALRRRAPAWASDYFRDEQFSHDPRVDNVLHQEGVVTLLAVPLLTDDRAVGILYCGHRERHHWTPDEVSLVSSMADHCARALEQARVLGEARARIARMTSKYDRLRARIQAEHQTAGAGHRMIDLVLGGADAQTLAAEAADLLDGSVELRDAHDRTLARHGDVPTAAPAVDSAVLDARALHRSVSGHGVTVVPVRAGGEDLGAVILGRRAPLDDAGHHLLHRAAQAAAVLFLVSRTRDADGPVRDETLDVLLGASPRGHHHTVQWAQRLGLDLTAPHVVAVARIGDDRFGRAGAWASAYAAGLGGAKTMREGSLVLLLPGTDAGAAAREVARRLGDLMNRPVTVGGAAVQERRDPVSCAHRQAARCVEALIGLGHDGAGATMEELGFVGMLLGERRTADDFVDETLGPVVAYDQERSTDLEKTLDAYFAAGGSPTYAAETLTVHVNTVSRRLDRITQLLGPDWQESSRALEIQLALRLRRVTSSLHDRNRGPHADTTNDPKWSASP
ncbi:helix-turn-helix domain-containing protein [Streptomyces sp. NPDC058676]